MADIKAKRQRRREEEIRRIMATCVHFTGIQHEMCKAGVNYHEQYGSGAGCFANIACTQAYPRDGFPVRDCQLKQYPSREDAERQRYEEENHTRRAIAVINAVHADAESKGLGEGCGGAGEIECPKCGSGIVRYSVASYNGHIRGACSTKNCMSWME